MMVAGMVVVRGREHTHRLEWVGEKGVHHVVHLAHGAHMRTKIRAQVD